MKPKTKAIQVVVDPATLRAADQAARRAKVNRSELFRRALRAYLDQARTRELEEAHRRGYERFPLRPEEVIPVEALWREK